MSGERIAGKIEVSVGVSFEPLPETGAPGPWIVIVINGNPIGLAVPDAMHFASQIADCCQQVLTGIVGSPEVTRKETVQ
jgi:hypothetical protein